MTSFLALARRRETALAALAVGMSLSATEVHAQGQVLEEIVVSAQFREQNLQQTPLAITAFNSEMMDARSQTSIYEVSAQAPNVTLKPQGPAFGPSLVASIRGVGQYDFNPALEPGVGIYVDDVYYATLTGSIFDLLDLDRVEILRGPQGTLAGKNSIGGAVKLYSRKPEGDGTGMLEATYGSRDRIDLRGSFDFALAENLFARVAGVTKKQDGYVDRIDYGCAFPDSGVPAFLSSSTDCVLARDGEVDYNAVRGMLRWADGGPLEVQIVADYTHEDRNPAGSVLTNAGITSTYNPDNVDPFGGGAIRHDSRFVPPPGSYYNYASFVSEEDTFFLPDGTPFPVTETRADGRSNFEGWGVSGHIDYDLGDNLSLVSISAYRSYALDFSNDDDLSPLNLGLGQGDLTFWSFSQEVRLNGAFGEENQVEWTLGGFYMDQRSVYATYQDLRYSAVPLQFQGNDPVNADTKAAFAHVAWHATDALTLTGGIRYTDESKDYTFSRRSRDGSLNPFLGALDGVTGEYSGDRIDYRLNASYQWTGNLMTYAQFSTGFKGGGIGPRPFNPAQARPFGPETLDSYELGFKTDLADRTVRLNGALFYSEYNGIQLTLLSCPQFGGPGPCALPQNAGDAKMKGAELETTIYPMDGLMIDAAVSYLDFQYKNINPLAGGPDNPAGVQLDYVPPFTPEWKWSAGIQYEILMGDAGSLTPRVDASFQDDIFTNAVNTQYNAIEDYILANARLTWQSADAAWQASLAVTNLFDKYYALTSFDLIGAGAGYSAIQPGRPREWAVTVKRTF